MSACVGMGAGGLGVAASDPLATGWKAKMVASAANTMVCILVVVYVFMAAIRTSKICSAEPASKSKGTGTVE